jgi:hypothetical protein
MKCHDNSLSLVHGINEARKAIRTGIVKGKVHECMEMAKGIRKN